MREAGEECVVDLAIPCRDGVVTIGMTGRKAPLGTLCGPDVGAVR